MPRITRQDLSDRMVELARQIVRDADKAEKTGDDTEFVENSVRYRKELGELAEHIWIEYNEIGPLKPNET